MRSKTMRFNLGASVIASFLLLWLVLAPDTLYSVPAVLRCEPLASLCLETQRRLDLLWLADNSAERAAYLRNDARTRKNADGGAADLEEAFNIEKRCHDATDQSVEWLRFEDAIAMVDTATELSRIALSQGRKQESAKWLKEAMKVIDNKEDLICDMVPANEIASQYKKLLGVEDKSNRQYVDKEVKTWNSFVNEKFKESLRTLPPLSPELQRDCSLNFRSDYLDKVADALTLTGVADASTAKEIRNCRRESLDCAKRMTVLGDQRLDLLQLARIHCDEADMAEAAGDKNESIDNLNQALIASKKCVECINAEQPVDSSLLLPALFTESMVLKRLKKFDEAAKVSKQLSDLSSSMLRPKT